MHLVTVIEFAFIDGKYNDVGCNHTNIIHTNNIIQIFESHGVFDSLQGP